MEVTSSSLKKSAWAWSILKRAAQANTPMADIQKPSPAQETYPYPIAYATPVQTVVYVESAPGHARQTSVDRNGVMVGAWSTDIFSCCDFMIPNCCMVTFCPCVSLAQISPRLGVAPYRRTLVIFLLLIVAEIVAGLYPSTGSTSTFNGWHSSTSASSKSSRYSDDSSEASPIQSWIILIVRLICIMYVWHLRQTTRRLFRIPGGACGDCWSSCCCSCCALAQIATHIKSYKPGDCSFGPVDVLPPY
ncbi:unnamed protein product [Phytophthora fragariaefolia]|uniref:Unnamed protein product n=1 Tax=Phytophthora fragariaefolia TaxID=1490495 RepID=A0A9W6WJD4_9STRA|nr:unnamed protein product [Phytophthora fragariaefolia]